MAQIPPNLMEVMKELSKYIVKDKPDNVYQYAFEFFNKKIIERDGHLYKNYEIFQEQEQTENGNICKYILNKNLISGINKKKVPAEKSLVNNEKLTAEKIHSSIKENQRNYVIENASHSVKIKNFQTKSDSKSSLLDETILEEDSNEENEEANAVESNNKKNKSLVVLTSKESEKNANVDNLIMGPAAVAATAGIVAVGLSDLNSDDKQKPIENTEIASSVANENVDFVHSKNDIEGNYESVKNENLDSELQDPENNKGKKTDKSSEETTNEEVVDKENLVTEAADVENTVDSFTSTQNELHSNKENNLDSSNNGVVAKDHDDSNEHVNLQTNIDGESDKPTSGSITDTMNEEKNLNLLNPEFPEKVIENPKENVDTSSTELSDSNSEKTVIEKKISDVSETSKNEVSKGNENDLDISNEKKINGVINALDENNKPNENVALAELNLEHPISEKNSIDVSADPKFTKDEVDTGNLNQISENKPKSLHERDLNILYDVQNEDTPEIHQQNIEPQVPSVVELNSPPKKISKRSVDSSEDLNHTNTKDDSAEESKILNYEDEPPNYQNNNDSSKTEVSELNLKEGLDKLENQLCDPKVNAIEKEEPANNTDIKSIEEQKKKLSYEEDAAQNIESNKSASDEANKIENEPEKITGNINKLVLPENFAEVSSEKKENDIDSKNSDLDGSNNLSMEKNENEVNEKENLNFSPTVLDAPKNDSGIPTEHLQNIRDYDSQINSKNTNVKVEIKPSEKDLSLTLSNENLYTDPGNVEQNITEKEENDIGENIIEKISNFENKNANDKKSETTLSQLSKEDEITDIIENQRKEPDTVLSEISDSNLDSPILKEVLLDSSENNSALIAGNKSENIIQDKMDATENVEAPKQNTKDETDNHLLTVIKKDSDLDLLNNESLNQNKIYTKKIANTIEPTSSLSNLNNMTLKNNSIDVPNDLTTVDDTKEENLNNFIENKSENLISDELNPNLENIAKHNVNGKNNVLSNYAELEADPDQTSKEPETEENSDTTDLSEGTKSNTNNSLVNESSIDLSKDSNIIETKFLGKNSNDISESTPKNLVRNELNVEGKKHEAMSQENLNQDYHENDANILPNNKDTDANPNQLIIESENLHTDVLSAEDLNLPNNEVSKNNLNNVSENTSTEDNVSLKRSIDLAENLTIHENKIDDLGQKEFSTIKESLNKDDSQENDMNSVLLGNENESVQSENGKENLNKNSDANFSETTTSKTDNSLLNESSINSSKDSIKLLEKNSSDISETEPKDLVRNELNFEDKKLEAMSQENLNQHYNEDDVNVLSNNKDSEANPDQLIIEKQNLHKNTDVLSAGDLDLTEKEFSKNNLNNISGNTSIDDNFPLENSNDLPNNSTTIHEADQKISNNNSENKENAENRIKNSDGILSAESNSNVSIHKENAELLLPEDPELNLDNSTVEGTSTDLPEVLPSEHKVIEKEIVPESLSKNLIKEKSKQDQESVEQNDDDKKDINLTILSNQNSEGNLNHLVHQKVRLQNSDSALSEAPESTTLNNSIQNEDTLTTQISESDLKNPSKKKNSINLSEDLTSRREISEDNITSENNFKNLGQPESNIKLENSIKDKSLDEDVNVLTSKKDSENDLIQLNNENENPEHRDKILNTVSSKSPESHSNNPIFEKDDETLDSEAPESNLENPAVKKSSIDLSEDLETIYESKEDDSSIPSENKSSDLILETKNLTQKSPNMDSVGGKNSKEYENSLSRSGDNNERSEHPGNVFDTLPRDFPDSFLSNPISNEVPNLDNPTLEKNTNDILEDLKSTQNIPESLIKKELAENQDSLKKDNDEKMLEFITPNNEDSKNDSHQLGNENENAEDINKKSDVALLEVPASELNNRNLKESTTEVSSEIPKTNLDNSEQKKESINLFEDLGSVEENKQENTDVAPEDLSKSLIQNELHEIQKNENRDNEHEKIVENMTPDSQSTLSQLGNDKKDIEKKADEVLSDNTFITKDSESNFDNSPLEKHSIGYKEIDVDNSNADLENESKNLNVEKLNEKEENLNRDHPSMDSEINLSQLATKNESPNKSDPFQLKTTEEWIIEETNSNTTENKNNVTEKIAEEDSYQLNSDNGNPPRYLEAILSNANAPISILDTSLSKSTPLNKTNLIHNEYSEANSPNNPENLSQEESKFINKDVEGPKERNLSTKSIEYPETESDQIKNDNTESVHEINDTDLTKLSTLNIDQTSIEENEDAQVVQNTKTLNISDKNNQVLKKDNSAENKNLEEPFEINSEKNKNISTDVDKVPKDIIGIVHEIDDNDLTQFSGSDFENTQGPSFIEENGGSQAIQNIERLNISSENNQSLKKDNSLENENIEGPSETDFEKKISTDEEQENKSININNENKENDSASSNNKIESSESFSTEKQANNDGNQEKNFEENNQQTNKLSFDDTEDVIIKSYRNDGQSIENDSTKIKLKDLLPESKDHADEEDINSLDQTKQLQDDSKNSTQLANDNSSLDETEKESKPEDFDELLKHNEEENDESTDQTNGHSSKPETIPFENQVSETNISSSNVKLVDNTSDSGLQNVEPIIKPINSNKKQGNNYSTSAVEVSKEDNDPPTLKNNNTSEGDEKLVEALEEPFEKTNFSQSTESNKIKIIEEDEVNSLISNKDEINDEPSFSDSLQNTDINDEGSSLNNYDSLTGDNIIDESSVLDKTDDKLIEPNPPFKENILHENGVEKEPLSQEGVEMVMRSNQLKPQNSREIHLNKQKSEIEVKEEINAIANQDENDEQKKIETNQNQTKDQKDDQLVDLLENKYDKEDTTQNNSSQAQKSSIEMLDSEALKPIIDKENEAENFEKEKTEPSTKLSNIDGRISGQNDAGSEKLEKNLGDQVNDFEKENLPKTANLSGDETQILTDIDASIKDAEEKNNLNFTENSSSQSDEIESNSNVLIGSKANDLNKNIGQDITSSSRENILKSNKTNESDNELNEECANIEALSSFPDNLKSVATVSNGVDQEKLETESNEVPNELKAQKSVEMKLEETQLQQETSKPSTENGNTNDIDEADISRKNGSHTIESDKIQVDGKTIEETNIESKLNSSELSNEEPSTALTANDKIDNTEPQQNEENEKNLVKIVLENTEQTKTDLETEINEPNLKPLATKRENFEEKKMDSTEKENLDQNAEIEKLIIKEIFWQDTSSKNASTLDTDETIDDEKGNIAHEVDNSAGKREELIKEIFSKEKIRFKSPSDPVEVMDKLIDNDSKDIEDPSRYKPDSLEALYYNIKANNYLKSKSLENLQDAENNFSLMNSLNTGAEEEDQEPRNHDLSSNLESSASFDLENNMKIGNEIRSAIENVNDSSSLESTVTESTIINAVTKIQAVGRGYLTRLKLKRGDFGKSLPAKHYYKSYSSYSADSLNLERRASKYENVRKSNSWPEVKYSSEMKYLKRLELNQESIDFDESDKPDDEKIAQSSALASRRLTLQRTDAVQINSTENTADPQAELKKVVMDKEIEKKWLMIRQCTMPVQIDAEILRLMPKHLRKRIRSADTEKKKKERKLMF